MLEFCQFTQRCLWYSQISNIAHVETHFLLENLWISEPPLVVAGPGFSPGGVLTPKSAIIFQFFPKNCMKMKEFGPPGRVCIPGTPLRSANA